ncbi:DUF6185 family protein [Streptomyces sp. NPDC047009]|uniref:DUF6185 family protein n=1 Tax=Streptomyces sp. NPDC047009 TaxID=3154496 RepID=UPI0033E1E036
MTTPAWKWITLAVAAFGWCAAQPAQAHAADTTDCPAIRQPTKVSVNSKLLFNLQNPDFAELRQVTIITIPERQWRLANDLTFGAKSRKYQNAMHCLLLGSNNPKVGFGPWHPEWRSTGSPATKENGLVKVRYESWNLINPPGEYEVGPWRVKVKPGEDWAAVLYSPGALNKASWQEIKVDPDGLQISDANDASSADKDDRVWRGLSSPDNRTVHASIVPPRDPALASSSNVAWIGSLGILSWWICASAVIAASALPFLREAALRDLAKMALKWAGLSAALGLTLLLVLQPSPKLNSWRAFVGILSGLALVLLAQPWLPPAQGSDSSRIWPRKKDVVVVTTSVAAVGLLVVLAPHLFDLPPHLMPTARPAGIVGLTLLDLSMLWLWLTAMVAWSWRFAQEGLSTKPKPSDNKSEPTDPARANKKERSIRLIGPIGVGLAVVAVAVAVVACRIFSFRLEWERANQMGEASTIFGTDYRSALSQQLANFASMGPQWTFSYTWVLTGIALVALLYSNFQNKQETAPLGPKDVGLLLVTAVFAIVVALRGAAFAGSSAAVYGLWLPLNMATLYALVKIGYQWSVLGRVEKKTGENCVAAELSTEGGHGRLMADAHRCRDLLHRLHLMSHGREDGTTRQRLERQLHVLHHWHPAGCQPGCLPDPVSVVDVALSWGPGEGWWDNARIAAKWAAIFGIIPSLVTAWYEKAYGAEHWTFTLNLPTGIPDTVGKFLTQEISFAGAGLVLGALWRLLPGERGPVRAVNLFIAWLLPIAVVAWLNLDIGRRALGLEVLSAVLMLMVLTLTSMCVDTDTFGPERHYQTKRLALLASIYQVHGLSGQIAFFLAQLAAAVTIWHEIVTTSK